MNDVIYDKLDEVLLTIRNNKKVIRMKELKKKIENDVDLKNKLDKFHEVWKNEYSEEYVNLKKEILDNQYVKEYKTLENELYFTVLDINKELNSLTGKRKC